MTGVVELWPAPVAPGPVEATVTVPGSKSMTNRALVLAGLADGPARVENVLEHCLHPYRVHTLVRKRDGVAVGDELGPRGGVYVEGDQFQPGGLIQVARTVADRSTPYDQ